MGSRFYRNAQRPLRAKAPLEGFGAGTQPTLLEHLTTLLVDEAQVGVLVAQVQSGCRLWLLFATIHRGPILLSLGRFRARRTFADPKGTAYRGSAFSSHLLRTLVRAK